jgi:thiosulfate reductase cytochrome b subunit
LADYEPSRKIHPLFVRVTHWVNAVAMVCMIMSGWRIYDASPIFHFHFATWLTLGGWLGGALAWHFAAMWVLAVNGLAYVLYGLISGHFRRKFLPVGAAGVWRDIVDALRFHLVHRIGVYNYVQRLLYLVVVLLGIGAVISGVSIWKPVQFQAITTFLGGYDVARIVHFLVMAGIVGFLVIHVALVVLVPRTLPPMITGRDYLRRTRQEAAR